jgi:hypothetical protein
MERCFGTLLGLERLLFICDLFNGAVSVRNSDFTASSDCIIK